VCRAPLAALALRLPEGGGTFLALEERLELLQPLIDRCYDGEEAAPLNMDALIFASPPTDAQDDDACALCMDVLAAFAAHSNVQCMHALKEHALGAACAAMRRAPFSARVTKSGSELLTQLVQFRCGAMDEATGAPCVCTPAPLAQAVAEEGGFPLVLHNLRAFRGAATRDGAARDAFVAACRAADCMLSRGRLSPRPGRTHDALVRMLCATLADMTASAEEIFLSRDADVAAAHVVETLASLALYRRGAAHAPGTTACVTRALVGAVDRACAAAAAFEMSHDATLFAAMCFLKLTLLRPRDAAAPACARAAAGAGGVDALLRFVRLKTGCACHGCAGCFANAPLPLLRALCAASPAARVDALAHGIMPTLAAVAHAFSRFDAALSAAFALAASCMTPPPPPLSRLAVAEHADDAPAWRAACADAAAAAAAAELLACAAETAFTSTALLVSKSDDGYDEHPAARRSDGAGDVRLSAGSQALLALTACAAHGDAATKHAWLEQASAEDGVPGGGARTVAAAVLHAVTLFDAGAPLHAAAAVDAAACHTLSRAAGAISALMAALLAHPHIDELTGGVLLQPSVVHGMLLPALLQPFAQERLCGCGACDAARGAACAAAVAFALQRGPAGARALMQPPYDDAVLGMLVAALEQPWLPAMRREAPRTLALLAAMHHAGCCDGGEEEEEEGAPADDLD
jgi:hypothetical protein